MLLRAIYSCEWPLSTDFSILPRAFGRIRGEENRSIQKLRPLRLTATHQLLMAVGASRLVSITESFFTIMAGGTLEH